MSLADVLVHGYLPGAFDQMGYTEPALRASSAGYHWRERRSR